MTILHWLLLLAILFGALYGYVLPKPDVRFESSREIARLTFFAAVLVLLMAWARVG